MGQLHNHSSLNAGSQMQEVEFVCLANSRKDSPGRCVAGLRMDNKKWIRPVSTFPNGTLYAEFRYEDREEARLLDVIKVVLDAPRYYRHQPENWVLSDNPWMLVRKMSLTEAEAFLRDCVIALPNLLGNSMDRVSIAELSAKPMTESLVLVEPDEIKWRVRLQNTRQTRAVFKVNGQEYDWAKTDPIWEQKLFHLQIGDHDRGAGGVSGNDRVLFTVSLGELFKGYCYKLVAAVIVLPR